MEGAEPSRRSLREAAAVYRDRRMLLILAMGFSSGLPLLLTAGTLAYWLRTLGVDLTTIGLFSLVGLPYSFKFLWAPVVDHVPLPWLTRRLGRRRSFALVAQLALAASILALGASDPTSQPLATAAAALAVAFWSATQDIVVDAYRIEVLAPDEQGPGASATQLGYRFGMLASGAGAVALADFVAWQAVFVAMAALVGVGVAAVLLAPEPRVDLARSVAAGRAAAPGPAAGTGATGPRTGLARALRDAVLEPLLDFATRRGWVAILLLAFLYKFGDAISGAMANPFYKDLGFTGVEIASVTKVWGLAATLAGIAVGGALVVRLGTLRALLVGGVLQAATNLLYSALALLGRDLAVLGTAVGADSFTGGLGSAAIVAYLSGLCRARFTATQFALLTSFSAIGRTAIASGSGWLAEHAGWAPFFALTAAFAIPGLALALLLMRIERGTPGEDRASAPSAERPASSAALS
jgi:PAT family beta-lactamase induction signal transducer AmpG